MINIKKMLTVTLTAAIVLFFSSCGGKYETQEYLGKLPSMKKAMHDLKVKYDKEEEELMANAMITSSESVKNKYAKLHEEYKKEKEVLKKEIEEEGKKMINKELPYEVATNTPVKVLEGPKIVKVGSSGVITYSLAFEFTEDFEDNLNFSTTKYLFLTAVDSDGNKLESTPVINDVEPDQTYMNSNYSDVRVYKKGSRKEVKGLLKMYDIDKPAIYGKWMKFSKIVIEMSNN